MTRRIVILVAVLFLTVFSAPPAFAIEPPAIDPSALPPDETGPDSPTELRRVCSTPISFPGANFAAAESNSKISFNISEIDHHRAVRSVSWGHVTMSLRGDWSPILGA